MLAIRLSLGTQEIQIAEAKQAKPNDLRMTRNVDGEVGARACFEFEAWTLITLEFHHPARGGCHWMG